MMMTPSEQSMIILEAKKNRCQVQKIFCQYMILKNLRFTC